MPRQTSLAVLSMRSIYNKGNSPQKRLLQSWKNDLYSVGMWGDQLPIKCSDPEL